MNQVAKDYRTCFRLNLLVKLSFNLSLFAWTNGGHCWRGLKLFPSFWIPGAKQIAG